MKASAASASASSFFSFSPNLNHTKRTHFFVTTTTTPPPPPIRSLSLFKSSKHFYSPPLPPFSCSAAITLFSDSPTSDLLVAEKLEQLTTEFQSLPQAADRVRQLLNYAKSLPTFPDSSRVDSNRVMGCTTRVWLVAKLDEEGKMRFKADSDSDITRGFLACLVWLMDGAEPEEVMKVKTEELAGLNVSLPGTERSRVNTWHNVLVSMQKRTKRLVAEKEGREGFDAFPSLVITAAGIKANGSYAEAQAMYLLPDENKVQELVRVLKEKEIGVAAHFYMDPEVQGVLTAAMKYWPHIHISDSLVMADRAVNMAKAGCKHIMVLGVDFMSENARAILDQAGFGEVDVYRMSSDRIGCTLADAASTPAYMDYLAAAAAESSPSLHVIYINTSLETKAYAHELVPTITCTSSNVLKTVLQAFAQIPDVKVWYGPDTYMGANLAKLFQQMTIMSDEEIAEIHPAHNRDSIKAVLSRLHYFQDGTCIVHHMFGQEVVEKINAMYCDAFMTAHLEVPGEMFSLAMDAKKRGMGVVGSTQNILDFVKDRVKEALSRNVNDHLQFVLGTESGMVTSIVAAVRELLGSVNASGGAKISVEIVFPVSSDSVTGTSSEQKSAKIGDVILSVVPGVASGEGCSLHGGCASCPYMKMNTLSSLLKICRDLPDNKASLTAYQAARFKSETPNGKSIADVGCEPVLHMRHFQATKELPEKLVKQVVEAVGKGVN